MFPKYLLKDRPVVQALKHGLRLKQRLGERFDKSLKVFCRCNKELKRKKHVQRIYFANIFNLYFCAFKNHQRQRYSYDLSNWYATEAFNFVVDILCILRFSPGITLYKWWTFVLLRKSLSMVQYDYHNDKEYDKAFFFTQPQNDKKNIKKIYYRLYNAPWNKSLKLIFRSFKPMRLERNTEIGKHSNAIRTTNRRVNEEKNMLVGFFWRVFIIVTIFTDKITP